MQGKQMFKVVSPIEKKGGTYWVRCGTGFTNKDDSINMYIDVLPVPAGKELTLQLRAMTEEDFRPRGERGANGERSANGDRGERGERASFNLPRSAPGVSNMSNFDSLPSATSPHDANGVPF